MAKRKLRIVQETPQLGVCERCNMQFPVEMGEVQKQFDAHKCKLQDFAQNAARIVREATENK